MSTSRSRRIGLVLLASVAGVALALPAQAQFFGGFGYRTFEYGPPRGAPGRFIIRQLMRQGFHVLALRRNGEVLLADVIDQDDRRARLILDPEDGEILQKFANIEPRPPRAMARPDEFAAPPGVIRGPNPGYLQDGSLAPSPSPPAAVPRSERPAERAQRPKPKPRVAHVNPAQRVARPAPAPSAAPSAPGEASAPAPGPSAAPVASAVPEQAGETARSAPATQERPQVAVTAAAPAPAAAAPASAPAATRVPSGEKAKGAQPKPGYANGVPINPLD